MITSANKTQNMASITKGLHIPEEEEEEKVQKIPEEAAVSM